MSRSALCFSAFWVWAFANNFGTALCPCWLLCEDLTPDITQRRRKIGASFCLLWFGSCHGSRWAEVWGLSLLECQGKGSCCCGEIQELPLPAGQPVSSWGWPLSKWAAKSPKLTGWNPGLIKPSAKPPIDFKALSQPSSSCPTRLTPLFMGLLRWVF